MIKHGDVRQLCNLKRGSKSGHSYSSGRRNPKIHHNVITPKRVKDKFQLVLLTHLSSYCLQSILNFF